MRFTFEDILKSNFIDNYNAISIFDIVSTLFLAFAIGLFIFYIYKKTYAGVMYSKSFGISLIAMTMITAMLILAVTSNIVLSLGMVGALSIVRFRTAIKEPSDIAFLFWAIAGGIILSAGFFPLALIGSIAIGLMLLVFSNWKSYDQPYILVVHLNNKNGQTIVEKILKEETKKYALKSKSITENQVEINYEIRLDREETDFVTDLYQEDLVDNIILVSYNGDYLS